MRRRALTLEDAARLLRLRGEAMQSAVPVGDGAMAALLGLEFDVAREVARRPPSTPDEICDAANDNGGGQVVICGSTAAVERAMEIATARGARARDHAPGVRPLPLRPDAAGRRGDGGGAAQTR